MRVATLTATGALVLTLVAACSSGSSPSTALGTAGAGSTGSPAPSASSPSASTPTATATPTPSAQGNGRCAPLATSTVAALFQVPVGNQAFEQDEGGGYACLYGIGANANLPGSQLPGARSDLLSVTLVSSGGAAIYQSEVANYSGADTFVALTGVGDKAGFAYSSQLQNPPVIVAVKGGAFCDVSMNLASGAEVGLAASTGVKSVKPADAAALAAKEAQFCSDRFAGG